uniref:Transmembrane protein n=1 Tax=Syphacia muris TaxID=451379 RepID=A0A0N5AY21_9BILA
MKLGFKTFQMFLESDAVKNYVEAVKFQQNETLYRPASTLKVQHILRIKAMESLIEEKRFEKRKHENLIMPEKPNDQELLAEGKRRIIGIMTQLNANQKAVKYEVIRTLYQIHYGVSLDEKKFTRAYGGVYTDEENDEESDIEGMFVRRAHEKGWKSEAITDTKPIKEILYNRNELACPQNAERKESYCKSNTCNNGELRRNMNTNSVLNVITSTGSVVNSWIHKAIQSLFNRRHFQTEEGSSESEISSVKSREAYYGDCFAVRNSLSNRDRLLVENTVNVDSNRFETPLGNFEPRSILEKFRKSSDDVAHFARRGESPDTGSCRKADSFAIPTFPSPGVDFSNSSVGSCVKTKKDLNVASLMKEDMAGKSDVDSINGKDGSYCKSSGSGSGNLWSNMSSDGVSNVFNSIHSIVNWWIHRTEEGGSESEVFSPKNDKLLCHRSIHEFVPLLLSFFVGASLICEHLLRFYVLRVFSITASEFVVVKMLQVDMHWKLKHINQALMNNTGTDLYVVDIYTTWFAKKLLTNFKVIILAASASTGSYALSHCSMVLH